MNGCSKAYAMTGWRIGFCGAPVALIKAMDKLQSQSTSNTSSISQAAAVEALNGPQEGLNEMAACTKPAATWWWTCSTPPPASPAKNPRAPSTSSPPCTAASAKPRRKGTKINNDEDFVIALLDEEGVAAVHGSAFVYPGHFRISYATSTEALVEACTPHPAVLHGA